jgi:hypothetical protein
MKSGLRAYFDLIYRQLDCYATWLPGTGVAVGDIGRLSKNGSFMHTGTLAGRAHLPKTRERQEPSQTVSTSDGVTFSAGATVRTGEVASVLAAADARLDITFDRVMAAALILQDVVRHEFVDELPVRTLMKSMLAANTLEPDEVVVTYVLEAGSGVVATTYNARTGTDIEVDETLGNSVITVARMGGHLKIVSQSGSQTIAAAEEDRPLTPVYRALALRSNRHWWTFWRSWLEVQPVIPTLSRGGHVTAPGDILGDRPSLALPEGEADGG